MLWRRSNKPSPEQPKHHIHRRVQGVMIFTASGSHSKDWEIMAYTPKRKAHDYTHECTM